MSRWLSSVNNLLESLDDRAETVADDTETTARSAAALAGRFLRSGRPRDSDDDDDEEYEGSYLDSGEEEEYYDEEDDEEYEVEEEEYEEVEEEEEEEEVTLNLEVDPDKVERSNSTPLFDDDRVADVIDNQNANANETTETSTPVDIATELPMPPPPAQEEEEMEEGTSETTITMLNIDRDHSPVRETSQQRETNANAFNYTAPVETSPVPTPPQPTTNNTIVEVDVTNEKEEMSEISIAPADTAPVVFRVESDQAKSTPNPVPPPPPRVPPPPPVSTDKVGTSVTASPQPQLSSSSAADTAASNAAAAAAAATIAALQQQLNRSQADAAATNAAWRQQLKRSQDDANAANAAWQQQLKKAQRDTKKSTLEVQRLSKLSSTLQAQLEASQAEIQAQQDELQRAADTMQEERDRLQEEQEDLLDENEDEVQKLKDQYETQIKEQKEMYLNQLEELQARVQQEETKRMQEGGDMTEELEDALARERDALKRLDEIQTDKKALEAVQVELEAQQESLQSKVETLSSASVTATQREGEAEEKLDAALEAHKRQLHQRQTREAELERTVAELGAALTLAQQQRDSTTSGRNARALVGEETAEVSYKDQYEVAAEELETVKTQLSLATQRSEFLQQELHDVSNERVAEAAALNEGQREHDDKVAELSAQVSRLEGSLRELKQNDDAGGSSADETSEPASENDRVRQLTRDMDRSKRQIASLSDQLIRQQGSTEVAKSEILALKGRLQSANSRADAAEKSDEKVYEMEGGGVTYTASKLRRRVKGGQRGRSNQLQTRSVRSALGMRLNEGNGMDQVALTVDALDSWMLDTGSIMRHEPLARVAFAAYLTMLHLWCFVLVFFHAIASEHGDLGKITASRVPGPSHIA
jgi:DNA repair exonuclease SbcCD ATPase subunit